MPLPQSIDDGLKRTEVTMQTKNQWKRPRDWKVVAGAGAVAALGITGLVLANPADGTVPDAISLEERATIAET